MEGAFSVLCVLALACQVVAPPPPVPAPNNNNIPVQNNNVPQQQINNNQQVNQQQQFNNNQQVNQQQQFNNNNQQVNQQQQQFNNNQQQVNQQQQQFNNNQQQVNNQQHNQEQEKPMDSMTQLANHPSCVDDVKRLCKGKTEDETGKETEIRHNFEVLDCFNSYEGDQTPPSSACQTVVYEYKRVLTTDYRFEQAGKDVCKDLIKKLEADHECRSSVPGAYLPCLMELAWGYDGDDDAEDSKYKNCFNFMNKMQRVIFSDYHLVHPFLEACKDEVAATSCGLIFSDKPQDTQGGDKENNVEHHNQGPALDCLLKTDLAKIGNACKHQMMRVAELQADDYHLDRPLFFACRADREKFCSKVQSGEGKVYRCLMEHTQDNSLSPDCHEQIIKRERLMQEDAKADKTFYTACLPVLKKTNCVPDADKHAQGAEIGMASVLKCLMNYEETDEELDVPVECTQEIELFQSNLMDEYQITPGVVHHCHNEIHTYCKGLRKANEQDGTVHCLMGLAMPTHNLENKGEGKSKLSEECMVQVTGLLDETRPAKSILAIDGFLHEQCATQLTEYCVNNKEPLDCLMQHIQDGKISQDTDCAKHLLELEYFISRNYKHDMTLVKACHKDIAAHKLDHHLRKDENGPESDGLVFAQLYKIVREQITGGKVIPPEISNGCITEVLKSVHERAVSIDLNPELEEVCLPDLVRICSSAQHGEELGCLQEKLDQLKNDKCKEMMGEWIAAQDEDYQLDYILMKACEPTIKTHCADILNGIKDGEIDEGEVITCLIEHKYDDDMDPKCFAGIEHHQLVGMQDFNFNKRFRDACKPDFEKYCEHAKSKQGVIYCLADIVRNDTLLEHDHRVSQKCRYQLRSEFLALEDTINLDPVFARDCKSDIESHCYDVHPGPGEDAEKLFSDCLRTVDPEKLKESCAKRVFKLVKAQNAVAGASSHVFRVCKPEIKKFCKEQMKDPETLLGCLDDNYDDASRKCQKALDEDEEEDNQDIRLNPALYIPCKQDIHQFCEKELNSAADDTSLHGIVIECLKLEYVKGQNSGLTDTCSNQMHLLAVKVQTRDYKQDYVLTHACDKEITECTKKSTLQKDIIECLRKKLFDGELKNDEKCQAEVFRLITENRVDIHTDAELHEACVHDIQDSICRSVTAGSGRVMSCLLSLYDAGTIKSKRCIDKVKNRKELWEHAAKMMRDQNLSPPETLKQVWEDMSTSSSRWYFFSVILGVLAVILVLGVLCGRASKRLAAEIKDR